MNATEDTRGLCQPWTVHVVSDAIRDRYVVLYPNVL